jgi:FkbM family methyltransferase
MPAPVEAAVGPQAGEARIHVSARDDSSSLLPITARQSALFPGTAEAGTATIRVARLADEVPAADLAAPALLKLDVQGFCCCRRPAPGPMGGCGIRTLPSRTAPNCRR